MQPLYLCADVGGTQIKTALLTAEGALAAPISKAPARADLPREPMLEHLTACLLAAAENAPAGAVQGVRLAMPGPFDYPAGICKIEGLAKYGALYGVDLRAELGARLAARLGAAAGDIRFQNDVGGLRARRAAVRLRQRCGARGVCLHRHRLRQRLHARGGSGPGRHARYADGRLHLPAAAARQTD